MSKVQRTWNEHENVYVHTKHFQVPDCSVPGRLAIGAGLNGLLNAASYFLA